MQVPLCIDLDGTLLRTDTLHESALALAKASPVDLLRLPFWLAGGKASLKHRIAQKVALDSALLPYRAEVLALIDAARQDGRPVILVTAAAQSVAQGVADHLGLFDRVISSDTTVNLSSTRKAERLVDLYGEGGFDYAGNGPADLAVWKKARHAIVVSASKSLVAKASQGGQSVEWISGESRMLRAGLRCMRPHQWLKNLLIFVPLFAGHKVNDLHALGATFIAFLAFCMAASFGYLVNDLLDLDADRRHIRKRRRPLASGALPVASGIGLAVLLLLISIGLSVTLSLAFLAVVILYLAITLLYSLRLKRQALVDVFLLAGLYTIRIIAGAVAARILPSFWLLAFSISIFLSLALIKRCSELLLAQGSTEQLPGRGYSTQDLPILMPLGIGSGMIAVLIMALYINSPAVVGIYPEPLWLWLVPPAILYWIARVWLKTHRGEMHDDPVVFAARDPQSLVTIGMIGLIFLAGSTGWQPWNARWACVFRHCDAMTSGNVHPAGSGDHERR